ncbi:twin-arginine translocase TatA/TatE family subunit [Paenibacillus campi]|uniref:twin-arginine translocase TatA/TatE family subunit n=1 Tax=Paenibacillus campi TaxID=3106031 RepID=UPI002AFE69F0|nr:MULTISPECIES: twin-arginine translocase TatA/TatE family subunit [unclassified Paenibacillus]
MLSGIGPTGFILLIILALILFGPNKLPELGRAVGRTFREFKEGTRDMMKDDDKSNKPPTAEPVQSVQPVQTNQPQLHHESKPDDKQ